MKLLTGKQIKRKREAHNLTQNELGAMVGIKSSYLSFIEGGFRPESPEKLKVIEAITRILSEEPSDEAKKAVAERKARAKARKTRARRKAAKA